MACSWDAAAGLLKPVQTVPGLADEMVASRAGHCGSADIHVHSSGQWLYSSHRTNHTIAVHAIAADGTLSLVQQEPT